MEDQKIIELFLSRSETAVAETSDKYGGYLNRVAMNILNDLSDSEEVVNDTYLTAWNTIPPTIPDMLKYYLSKITRHLSLDRFDYNHAAKRSVNAAAVLDELSDIASDNELVENYLDSKRIGEIINDFLGMLDDCDCAIFVSRYFYADSIKRIAGKYRLTERQVNYRLSVMRSALRRKLEEDGIVL